MKVLCVSDLHLEFSSLEIKNTDNIDVLILAGDIIIASDTECTPANERCDLDKHAVRPISHQRYLEFFEQIASEFPLVLYVAGNHEHYNGDLFKTKNLLKTFLVNIPNVFFLNNEVFKYKGIVFFGGTMWTDFNKGDPLTQHAVVDMMNDFTLIRNDRAGWRKIRAYDLMQEFNHFKETLKFICEENRDSDIFVISHHAPSPMSINDRFRTAYLMNGAYASDLSEFILDHENIKNWVHGHMHDSIDYELGQCRIICNPRGYADIRNNFNNLDMQKVIVL